MIIVIKIIWYVNNKLMNNVKKNVLKGKKIDTYNLTLISRQLHKRS